MHHAANESSDPVISSFPQCLKPKLEVVFCVLLFESSVFPAQLVSDVLSAHT